MAGEDMDPLSPARFGLHRQGFAMTDTITRKIFGGDGGQGTRTFLDI
jgi:hypothetical protein